MCSRSRKDHKQHVSISAFGSTAGCSLPQDHTAAARAVPAGEQNVHEGIRLLKKQRIWRCCEAGWVWVWKQRSCDHSLVSISGGKISLLALLQPSAAPQAPLMNQHAHQHHGANWHQSAVLLYQKAAHWKLKAKTSIFFFFFWCSRSSFGVLRRQHCIDCCLSH